MLRVVAFLRLGLLCVTLACRRQRLLLASDCSGGASALDALTLRRLLPFKRLRLRYACLCIRRSCRSARLSCLSRRRLDCCRSRRGLCGRCLSDLNHRF